MTDPAPQTSLERLNNLYADKKTSTAQKLDIIKEINRLESANGQAAGGLDRETVEKQWTIFVATLRKAVDKAVKDVAPSLCRSRSAALIRRRLRLAIKAAIDAALEEEDDDD